MFTIMIMIISCNLDTSMEIWEQWLYRKTICWFVEVLYPLLIALDDLSLDKLGAFILNITLKAELTATGLEPTTT